MEACLQLFPRRVVTHSQSTEEVGCLMERRRPARSERSPCFQRAPCRIACINGTIYYDQLSVLRSVPSHEEL
jgi:hypothetical protein